MNYLTKMILGTVSLVGVALSVAPAFAEDAPAPNWTLTGYAAATSDYRFRGISQNDRNFAPQGSLNLNGPDGFYVGAWASQVDFDPTSSGNPHVELDIYGGKHTDLWGIDWNFMPYYYAYPSANVAVGASRPDYFELINQLTKAFGPVSLQASYAWSNNLAFDGGEGNALYGNVTYTLLDWLSISGNLGHQWAENARLVGSRDYTYGDIGATATYKGFALDVRYSGTDLGTAQCGAFYMATRHACSGGVVATLTYNFTLLP
ncbi:MAG: TorF family putative porin [Alphaproteobacteria bacterium]|nr:TorF family putative porin [Alphaproteobacteria bacterium]